jgi:hypothetical protein
MGHRLFKWYLVLLMIGFICIPLASAVTIDISPHQVSPGDTITVTTKGLKDGSVIIMNLKAIVNNPGPTYKMEIGNLYFPINLDEASYKITNENTYSNTVNIVNFIPSIGYTFLTIGGKSVDNRWSGQISGEDWHDINGTFELIRMAGTTKLGGASQIVSTMEWNGIKQASQDNLPPGQENGGPEDFVFSFSQNGIKSGSIEVTILVDGTMVTSDKVVIGNPSSESTKGSSLNGDVKNNLANLRSSSVPTTGPLFGTDQGTGSGSMYSRFAVNKATTQLRNFNPLN